MHVPVRMDDHEFIHSIQSEPLGVRIPIFLALIQAILLHLGQERRIGGRAVEHPMVVANLAKECGLGIWAQAAGLLHDVLEDCEKWWQKVIATMLLLLQGPVVAFVVLALTNWYGQNHRRYFRQIIWASWLCWLVIFLKLLDRLHNIVCPYGGSIEKEKAKLRETLRPFQAACRICRRFIPKRILPKYNELLSEVITLARARLADLEAESPTA